MMARAPASKAVDGASISSRQVVVKSSQYPQVEAVEHRLYLLLEVGVSPWYLPTLEELHMSIHQFRNYCSADYSKYQYPWSSLRV